ncbi:MAG TPA: 23S rRNA (adenine(2503)-C(2))-methyltransferase RlmN [Chloroflexi bacterium]|nr:23S rRNA (adenine(2503)-C(2))-methyltransferase RlmN [Chloroflexota bacterium]
MIVNSEDHENRSLSDLLSLDLDALEEQLRDWGMSAAEARRLGRGIWRQLYHGAVASVESLTEVPSAVRNRLIQEYELPTPIHVARQGDLRLGAVKDLLRLPDGSQIEVVLLAYRDRHAVCVSTQVGCACGCVFCATGQDGFVRNLSASEIVAQVLHMQRWLVSQGRRVSNVVFMGMGEPLLNADTFKAVQRLVDPKALGIPPRRITLSTVGIVPGIVRLADMCHALPINLALSLHAATDELRDQLVPMNRTYPLAALHDALAYYVDRTQRHVFIEWTLISGVNDSSQQAEALIDWLRGLPAHVNLIPLNSTPSYRGEPTTGQQLAVFTAVLDRHGIAHTVRQRKGTQIAAGCGQLRALQTESTSGGTRPALKPLAQAPRVINRSFKGEGKSDLGALISR